MENLTIVLQLFKVHMHIPRGSKGDGIAEAAASLYIHIKSRSKPRDAGSQVSSYFSVSRGRVSREARIVLSLCYFRYEPTLFFISFRKITSLCGKACMVPDRLGGYGC